MQVVNQLIKHNKISICWSFRAAGTAPGVPGTAAYGEHKRFDFFVRHLLGHNPPDWNAPAR